MLTIDPALRTMNLDSAGMLAATLVDAQVPHDQLTEDKRLADYLSFVVTAPIAG